MSTTGDDLSANKKKPNTLLSETTGAAAGAGQGQGAALAPEAVSAVAAAGLAAKDAADKKFDKEALITSLKQMNFHFKIDPNLGSMSQDHEKNRYDSSIEELAKTDGSTIILDFQNCELTDAHLLIIFEILKHLPSTSINRINFSGKQKFNLKEFRNRLVDLWKNNPQLMYYGDLPYELKDDKEIRELWNGIIQGNSARILSFTSSEIGPNGYPITEYFSGYDASSVAAPATASAPMTFSAAAGAAAAGAGQDAAAAPETPAADAAASKDDTRSVKPSQS